MKADDILKRHEDANEMHLHEVDRKWIIEAMEEYAALRQQPVISLVCNHKWKLMRNTHYLYRCTKCGMPNEMQTKL